MKHIERNRRIPLMVLSMSLLVWNGKSFAHIQPESLSGEQEMSTDDLVAQSTWGRVELLTQGWSRVCAHIDSKKILTTEQEKQKKYFMDRLIYSRIIPFLEKYKNYKMVLNDLKSSKGEQKRDLLTYFSEMRDVFEKANDFRLKYAPSVCTLWEKPPHLRR